jgi:ABC-2 type transport system ATP-binding protein
MEEAMATLESTAAGSRELLMAADGRPAVEVAHLRKTYGTLVAVALALIGRPKIAVLDEMTTGLDPQARRDTWELIEGIRDRGVTIVLVTHFMEEAERLCDRVALIDRGRVVALDAPAGLAARARGGKSVRFLPSAPFDETLLTSRPEVSRLEHEGQHILVTGTGELVNVVILTLAAAGVTARDVQLDSSSLEDAFVKLTGKSLQKEGALA